jgi:hypothetical protein
MLFTYSNNIIKIDNNDHYFVGKVDKSIFPEIIKEEYEDIIMKSFNDYSDATMDVKKCFNEPYTEYIIEFSFHQKPIFFNSSINITMEKHMKDFKDYMNERMVKLEEQVTTLTLKLESLSTQLINDEKSEESESVNNEVEESDEESEEEIVVPPPKNRGKQAQAKVFVTPKKH